MYSQTFSVCIPTYNRPKLLEQCLESLYQSCKKNNIKIFIYISDNSNKTLEIVKKYSSLYSGIISYQSKLNQGHDLNHAAAIKLVDTKYTWLIGDDDIALEGSISYLVSFLCDNSTVYSLILLNALIVNNNLKPRSVHLEISENTAINSCLTLLDNYHDKLTFGMLVINVSEFNKYVNQCKNFLKTGHLYGGVIYRHLAYEYYESGRNNIIALSNIFVLLRQGQRKWTREICDIHIRLAPQFYKELDPIYKDIAAKKLEKLLKSNQVLYSIIRMRSLGFLDKDYINTLNKIFDNTINIKLYIVYKLPISFAKLLSITAQAVSKLMKFMGEISFRVRIDYE